jgi:hypothetical protein
VRTFESLYDADREARAAAEKVSRSIGMIG